MIYVLFGPPGVGKTFIGQLVADKMGWHFFDADVLYDDELKYLLRSGKYTQEIRDRFVDKLVATTERLVADSDDNIVIAEAFTKEKNRFEFLRHFDYQVSYVMVRASKSLAKQRMLERQTKGEHVVDEFVFEFVWDEFESPSIPHQTLHNQSADQDEIIARFASIVQSTNKEGK